PFTSIRDSGMSISKPTIATTTTMTTTFGSLKLWLPTTSEAAMLRCAVPKARTRRVSVIGPPSHHPTAKVTAIKRRPARMPPVPNTASTFLMFVTTRRSTKAMRLRLEMRLSSGVVRAGGSAQEQESHTERLVESQKRSESGSGKRRQNKICHHGQHDQTDIA